MTTTSSTSTNGTRSAPYRSLVRTASSLANELMTSKSMQHPPGSENAGGERRAVRQFPASVMDARSGGLEVYAEVRRGMPTSRRLGSL